MIKLNYICTLSDKTGESFSYYEDTIDEIVVKISDEYEAGHNAYWDIDILTDDLETGDYTIEDMDIETAEMFRHLYKEEWDGQYTTAYQVVTDYIAANS